MGAIKNAAAAMAGLVALFALMFLVAAMIRGTSTVAEFVLPYLFNASRVAITVCVFVLLPLSLFKATRAISTWSMLIAS